MSTAPEDAEPSFAPVVTLPDAVQARQVTALLGEANIPVRVTATRHGYVIAVPEPEVPVAAGVADHFLDWFRIRPEGEATLEEILAEFGPDDGRDVDHEVALDVLAGERLPLSPARRFLVGLFVLVALMFVVAAVVLQ